MSGCLYVARVRLIQREQQEKQDCHRRFRSRVELTLPIFFSCQREKKKWKASATAAATAAAAASAAYAIAYEEQEPHHGVQQGMNNSSFIQLQPRAVLCGGKFNAKGVGRRAKGRGKRKV